MEEAQDTKLKPMNIWESTHEQLKYLHFKKKEPMVKIVNDLVEAEAERLKKQEGE